MKFEHMREFVQLAEMRNFFGAAEALYTSQASLSRHIRAMEDELGGALFVRTTRKVELTHLGARLLPFAKQAVTLQEQYQAAVNKELEIIKTTLVIGVVRRWSYEKLPELLAQYRGCENRAKIDIKIAMAHELKEMLYLGKCNFAFLREFSCESDDAFARIPCVQDPVHIYYSENHPFSGKESVSIEDLASEPLVLPTEGSTAYELCMHVCKDAGFEPEFVFRNIDRNSMMNFVSRDLGVAILPYHSDSDLVPGVRYTKLTPERYTYINLLYTHRPMKELETGFIEFMKDNIPKIGA